MDALEKTNLVLAKILNIAMENGVSHWDLHFEDLDLDSSYETFFYPCVAWLENEGLIRVEEYNRTMGGYASGSVQNIALTARGMAILDQDVNIRGNEEKLSSAVTKVSEGQVDYHKFATALGGFLGGVIKSLG
ncbi:hypothetical protein ACVDG3_06220 [Meridianimarinicoccus sp. RP-17]|uniref:hypothetical protein n=1 Tax=Meridianimarinicoccus zhengii TaxID=2056810 RepID=UPI0013A69987|nr:hypothetical protein [Phycocomes zhengii]